MTKWVYMFFEGEAGMRNLLGGKGANLAEMTRLGKGANKKLHTGVCGEHGGDPSSVEFCHSIGLDYVSCSPLRVPIARLAAAQAEMQQG